MTRPRQSYEYEPFTVGSPTGELELALDTVSRTFLGVSVGVLRTYTLTQHERLDRVTQRFVRWNLACAGSCPWRAWLHESGLACVLHADDEVWGFAPAGELLWKTKVLGALLADEVLSKSLSRSTAGLEWAGRYPAGCFVPDPAGLVLALALPLGRYLLLDARTGERRAEVDSLALSAAAHEEASRAIRAALRTGRGAQVGGHFAALSHGADDACVALLVQLERVSATVDQTRGDEVGTFEVSLGRLGAQLCLVRLGVAFEPGNGIGPVGRPRPVAWRELLPSLQAGLTPGEVLERVGGPMFQGYESGKSVWEYDVRRDGAYGTHRLFWAGKKLARTAWVGDQSRIDAVEREGVWR